MKRVAVSGYFDPIHVGHIELMKLAKELGDWLIVIINNDEQTSAKKGRPFMNQEDRAAIIKELCFVDEVFISIDKDRTICKSLRVVKPHVFANGGDRVRNGESRDAKGSTDIPELGVCEELGIEIVEGLGSKIRSSSELIKNTEEVIEEVEGMKEEINMSKI